MNKIILSLFCLIFIACGNNTNKETEEDKFLEKPKVNEYFKDNFAAYIEDRFQGEDVSFSTEPITGRFTIKNPQGILMEYDNSIESFVAKTPIDFFMLVNGLYNLEMTVEHTGKKYFLKISRNDFANHYDVIIDSLANSQKFNDFLKKNYDSKGIKQFIEKYVKVSGLAS